MARVCEDCYSALISAWDNQLVTLHFDCLQLYIEQKVQRYPSQPSLPSTKESMGSKEALLILTARLLGATHRKIALLFSEEERQKLGEQLILHAAEILHIDPSLVDRDDVDEAFRNLAFELDWHEGRS